MHATIASMKQLEYVLIFAFGSFLITFQIFYVKIIIFFLLTKQSAFSFIWKFDYQEK